MNVHRRSENFILSLAVTAVVVTFPTITLGQPGQVGQVVNLDAIIEANDPQTLSMLASRFFWNSSPSDILEYSFHEHSGIAFLAMWQKVQAATTAKYFAVDAEDPVAIPRNSVERFIGYIEGRLQHPSPGPWKRCLRNGLFAGNGFYFHPQKHRPYRLDEEARVWRGSDISVSHWHGIWTISSNEWSVKIADSVMNKISATMTTEFAQKNDWGITWDYLNAVYDFDTDRVAIILHRDTPSGIIAMFDVNDLSQPLWTKSNSAFHPQFASSSAAFWTSPIIHKSNLYIYFAYSGGVGIVCLDLEGNQKWWFGTDIVQSNHDVDLDTLLDVTR